MKAHEAATEPAKAPSGSSTVLDLCAATDAALDHLGPAATATRVLDWTLSYCLADDGPDADRAREELLGRVRAWSDQAARRPLRGI